MGLKPVQPESAARAREKTGNPASFRILYVEDEDMNWLITERELRDEFSLTRARDAREVFALLATQSFDLILMDIQLSDSELDGIQLAHVLRGIAGRMAPPYAVAPPGGDKIPIVFITAYGSRYTKSSLCEVAAAEVVYKPVDFPALSACLRRLRHQRGPATPPSDTPR